MEVSGSNNKLNIGCGGKSISGYIGIDAVERSAADIIAPAHAIPLPDGCAAEIMAIHVWEHFYRWECDDVIKEWHRLLKPGGRLVLEMPDLFKFCQNILDGRAGKHVDQMGLWAAYGDPRDRDPGMNHRWAWHFGSIKPFLESAGFEKCEQETPVYHRSGRDYRDFRVVCLKK